MYGRFDDCDNGFEDTPSNALAAEYRFMRTGMWAEEDASRCPCHGSGYCLSDLGTWHECPVHYAGQPHPEDYHGDEPADYVPAPPVVRPAPVVYDRDEIPF